MTTFKMNGMTMTMNNHDFFNMMSELAKSVVDNGKNWKEFLAEIKFELVSIEE